jgi:hypothetical protein
VDQLLSLLLAATWMMLQQFLILLMQGLLWLELVRHLHQEQGGSTLSAQWSQLMLDLEQLLLPGLESRLIMQEQQSLWLSKLGLQTQ